MQPVRPHWGWFLLGPVILILGGIAALVLFIGGLTSITEGMQRVDIPGRAEVHVEEPGAQPLFFEERGVSQASAPQGLEVRILPAGGGAPVPIDAGFGNVTYNVNGVAGRKWGEADFPAAGTYEITTNVHLGTKQGQLAVGGNLGEKIAVSLAGLFGFGFGSFLLCAIVMLVVLVKRMGYRRRMVRQQYAAMPPGGMAPPPPGASY